MRHLVRGTGAAIVLLGIIYLVVALSYWIDRPPFSNYYGFNVVSSVVPGWHKYPASLIATDGTHVVIDTIDNVILIIRPQDGLSAGSVIRPQFDGSDVVIGGPIRQRRIPWQRDMLIVLDRDMVTRPLPKGMADRLYRPTVSGAGDLALKELLSGERRKETSRPVAAQ